MNKTIADYPAYRIYKAYDGRKFTHGDVIAIPYETARHGTLWRFYSLGTAAGYALQYGEDPIAAHEACKAKGHSTHWANQNATVLHNGPVKKEEVPGFNFGDEIILTGSRFRLDPAPNGNCKLTPLD